MKIFDYKYFIFLFVLVGLTTFLAFFLMKKDKKLLTKIFLIWSIALFASHFLKQLVYLDVNELHKSTAENICAVSTILFPLIVLLKDDNPIKDYLFLIGIIGGFAGVIYPTEAMALPTIQFETFRFYFCHYSLLAIPLLMGITGYYKPRIKNIVFIPLIFLGVEAIIVANEALFIFTGAYDARFAYTGLSRVELFFSNSYCNNGFAFGPTPDMGAVGEFVGKLCPTFMKTDYLNVSKGLMTYLPVIWLLIPSYILFCPIYFLLVFAFNPKMFSKNKKKSIK